MKPTKYTWTTEAAALPTDDFQLPAPLHVLLGEATDAARFFERYYKADRKAGRPGLASAGLPADLDAQIESLIAEVSKANAAWLLTVDPKSDRSLLERARAFVDEIGAVLEFHLDDGIEDANDSRLANVTAAHKDDPFTADALALALEDYSNLAHGFRDQIDGLGDFDASVIDEAKKLAKQLRALPPADLAASAGSRLAIGQRNRLLQLLWSRVRRVRAAARFVFRKHPEIAREASSVYERRKRLEAKRAAKRREQDVAPAT
jgi:hypothetical protein